MVRKHILLWFDFFVLPSEAKWQGRLLLRSLAAFVSWGDFCLLLYSRCWFCILTSMCDGVGGQP